LAPSIQRVRYSNNLHEADAGGGVGRMKNGNEQGRTFEASLEALEQIVRQLEDGDLPLEKSLELFEQGIRLSRECQERLSQAERRIEILLRDNQGRPVAAAFKEPPAESLENNKDEDAF
jgi:exodeoxyribonuclease VII small subunit